MSQINYQNDLLEYAKRYSELPFGECHLRLEFNHIPALIKEYVKGTVTLDYGCGPGKTTLLLKSLGLKAEGVDINPHMIQVAQQNDPLGKYATIESGKIKSEDDQYDFVFSSWVLIHAETKNELESICKEIARVLKTGGVFILIVDCDETYNKEWLLADTRFEQNKNISSGSIVATKFKANDLVIYSYYWTEEDYMNVLKKTGLTVLRTVKPLGTDDDGCPWINETHTPNAAIYVAQKL